MAVTGMRVGEAIALDQLFPDTSAAYAGQALFDVWPNDPWVKGSYAFYAPGQLTAFAGVEAVPEGRVYFAGEHTARYPARATMNGAVESGVQAAKALARAARTA